MRWVLLFILLFSTSLYANIPWIPNVRVSTDVPWDTLNQGESCFDVYGDSIFSICNTAERANVPIAPYAYSFDAGQTFTQIPFTDNTTGIGWRGTARQAIVRARLGASRWRSSVAIW